KTWIPVTKKNEYGVSKFKSKQGDPTMVCSGIPCIDGNCIDKSYMTNGEMMDSLSKLATVSQMKRKGNNISLFEGKARHCTKKTAKYSNCCHEVGKGWGKKIGAHCSQDEKTLSELRGKNLCVYVGKQSKGKFKEVVKHRYCCFANLLEKIVQEQGRAQIHKSFGDGTWVDCSGLTLSDIKKINFSTIDFSEFIEDVKKQFALGNRNLPNTDDVKARFTNSVGQMTKDDEEGNNENGFK
ncbi:MAG: conjugal transfer protein TraN, partial [Gammaproteobacteria bacterium]|nr:conjugal transfer protein TraN [Gammaproteobacteria bacterium]